MIFWVLAALSVPAVLSGCGRRNNPDALKYREKKLLMGTFVQLDVCQKEQGADKRESVYNEIWDRLQEIDGRMSTFKEQSDITRLNTSEGEPVRVSPDTYEVISRAAYFYQKSGGAFDVTVWPLVQLWRDSERSNRLPDQNTVGMTLLAVGLDKVDFMPGHTLKVLRPGVQIDLGGIAKGYAVDEAARLFRQHGIMNFYIDAGGDVYAGGKNCEGRLWRIGIRDPRDRGRILEIVEVSDRAVTTSGNYEQFYTIGGQQWSHIMDPKTGYPQKEVVSATVIAPSAMDADALSTALTVMGPQKGNELIEALDDHYASLIVIRDLNDAVKRFESSSYKDFHVN